MVSVRAAREKKMKGKSEGKGEPAFSFSFSGKSTGKWRTPNSVKHLQDKIAARKCKSTCHGCGQRGHWAGDLQCPGTRDTKFTTWPDDQMFPDREDYRATMLCVSILFVRILVQICSIFSKVTGTVPPALKKEIGRSVMESSESSESKSDLGDRRHSLSPLCRWLGLVGHHNNLRPRKDGRSTRGSQRRGSGKSGRAGREVDWYWLKLLTKKKKKRDHPTLFRTFDC